MIDWRALLVLAAHAGMSADEFWRSTPAELEIRVEVLDAQRRDRRVLAFLSGWAAEYCARQEELHGPQREYDRVFPPAAAAAAPKQGGELPTPPEDLRRMLVELTQSLGGKVGAEPA